MPERILFSDTITTLPGARVFRTAVALSILASAGCYEQLSDPITETDGRVTVTNDETVLADRMTYSEEEIPIDAPELGSFPALMMAPARAPSSVNLLLVASVKSPSILGTRLQATSVSRRSSAGFLVSYNLQGSPYLGAADYLLNWIGRFPVILSALEFSDSDVSAVALDGAAVYSAQATNDDGFATPAAIERMRFGFLGIRLENNARFDLSSFAATSVRTHGDIVYVTTGSTGHLYALNSSDLSVLGQYPLEDARWVDIDEENDRVVVVQGTPGRISVFEEGVFPGGSMNLLNTFSFEGADVPESKSTVEIVDGKAFIAAGPEGVQVMCLDNGSIIGSLPIPDPESLGLDPSVVTTNAVTVDGDLMFISNGEAGVYAAAGAEDFDDSGCAPQSISVIGQLRFGDLQSVNHVDYRSGVLFVAAGIGGVKIVAVTALP